MILKSTMIHRVLIYRFDEVPFLLLIQKAGAEAFKGLFEFSEAGLGLEAGGSSVFNGHVGAFREDEKIIPIARLGVEDRRIILDAHGTSEDADKIVGAVRTFLAGLAKREDPDFLQPIVMAEDSEIVARLEFPAEKLLSPVLASFAITEASGVAGYEFAKAQAEFAMVEFVVNYQAPGDYLDTYRISLSRKSFALGPRPGFPRSDQIYYSRAPVDTKTHLHLLEELERRLIKEAVPA